MGLLWGVKGIKGQKVEVGGLWGGRGERDFRGEKGGLGVEREVGRENWGSWGGFYGT